MIFGQSSYNKLKIIKKKKKIGTQVPWKNSSGTRVPWTQVLYKVLELQKKKKVHVRYNSKFQKSSYTFETRFLENRVSKQGHFPN